MLPEIADIALFPLREPVSLRTYTIMRVKTNTGLTGFGECMQASADDLAKARKFWLGKPATSRVTLQEAPLNAAMDMALLDIVGKIANAPVYRVLGGPTRNKVRAMASVEAGDPARAFTAGYRAVAVRLPAAAARNQGQAYQIQVRKLSESLRAGGGDFVLDAAASLTPGDAGSVAATLQSLHPLWLDEPCEIANLQTIRKISDESVVPLGFGRSIASPGVFQQLLRDGMVDVVRPGIAQFGITGCRRIAALPRRTMLRLLLVMTAAPSPPPRRCTWRQACPISSSSTSLFQSPKRTDVCARTLPEPVSSR